MPAESGGRAVAHVVFTANLQRHLSAEPAEVTGCTAREALEAVFSANASPRGYVLDDQASLRRHVVVFVDGQTIRDRAGLMDPIRPDSALYVMQPLSGG